MAIEVTFRSLFKSRPDKSALYKEIQPSPSVGRKSISRFQSARAATRLMRRNFSSRALELSGGQAIILSIPKAGAPGFEHFFVPTSVNVMAASSPSSRNATASPVFPGSSFPMIISNTGRKATFGTESVENTWSQKRNLDALKSFCLCAIPGIVLFLSMCR